MKKSFLKLNFLALALFFCVSCQTPATNTEAATVTDSVAVEATPTETTTTTAAEQTGESVTITYRSDGFRPGVASEWVSVKSVQVGDTQKITEMFYWSTADEKKMAFEIVSQKFTDGEISGYSGEVRFPGDKTTTKFSIMEDHFDLGNTADESQEFTQE
jgi:PBP1b-binding outer membrane lipoprotein LpoB